MKQPAAIICGVQKGGTKALIDYLAQHDKIYAYPHEIHFFSRERTYNKGFEWYCHRFDNAHPDQIAIEKSPSYIYTPKVAERIQAVLPDIKLIFILRDPVKRAYSHYWMNVRKGLERREFSEAIRAPQQPEPETKNYVSRGFYDEQLQQFYDIFDKDQILILQSTNLRNKTQETIDRVCDFINVDHYIIKEMQGKVGAQPRSKLYSFFLSYAIQSPILRKTENKTIGKIRKKLIGFANGKPYPVINEADKKYLEEVYDKRR
jgi:hypothetical protein